MLSELYVFLLASELFKVLLNTIHQVLGKSGLGVHTMLACTDAALRVAEIELLEDLILSDCVCALSAFLDAFFFLLVV